jgi:hypothetical protein
MRQDCKHFQSRTYPTGDTVRKCALDLAPEAPWQCPPACSAYERRLADVSWRHGTLITPPAPEPPTSLGRHDHDVGALLDQAEDIVNAAAASALAEIEAERRRQRGFGGRLRRLFGRRPV